LHVSSLRNNHTSVGIERLSDRDVDGNAADSHTQPNNPDEARKVSAGKQADESAAIPIPSGFKLTSGSGWTVEPVDSGGRDESDQTAWSVAVATNDEDKSQRLGIFISFDIGNLLSKREWQMTLEQEMAKVRQRVRQLLSARRKADEFRSA
jgi:hypothetical protein